MNFSNAPRLFAVNAEGIDSEKAGGGNHHINLIHPKGCGNS